MITTALGEKGEKMAKEWIVPDEDLVVDGAYFDYQELVRCKECRHNSLNRRSGNAYCEFGFGLYQLNDFCSRGERREDEAN